MSKINNAMRHLIYAIFLAFFIGCSEDIPDDSPETAEPVWDKTRTVKVCILSDLTGNNPFTVSGYSTVAAWAKKDESHLLILDKANVRFAPPRLHTGAKLAVLAERFPIFVPTSVTTDSYVGSTLLFRKPVTQMEMITVTDECRLMQTPTEIRPGLNVNISVSSFNHSSQITAALPQLKKAVEQSILVIGIMRRADLRMFQSALSETIQDNNFELTLPENNQATSSYCLYTLSSKKWKLRKLTETEVQNALKSFLLEVEYLK
jgi:hypothetical protein